MEKLLPVPEKMEADSPAFSGREPGAGGCHGLCLFSWGIFYGGSRDASGAAASPAGSPEPCPRRGGTGADFCIQHFYGSPESGNADGCIYYQNEESAKERQPYFVGKGWRDGGRAAALCGVVAAAGAAFLFNLAFNGSRLRDDASLEIQITAHRGSSQSAPENTMAASAMAVEELADYAEVDVQYSRDRGMVVVPRYESVPGGRTDRRVGGSDVLKSFLSWMWDAGFLS